MTDGKACKHHINSSFIIKEGGKVEKKIGRSVMKKKKGK